MIDQRQSAKIRRQTHLNISEVAFRLEIPRRTLCDWQARGVFPLPNTNVGQRRYYTVEAVKEIEKKFKEEK